VIATNEADARRLAGSRPVARRLRRIPIGSNLPEARPFEPARARERFGLPAGPLVGFFGFLTRDKGFDLLLRALARLPEPRPALVVIGGGLAATDRANGAYRQELEAALGRAAMPVLRLGHLPPEEAAAVLGTVDVVALPFLEGASLRRGTLVAALRAGLPVLTTDPGPRESLAPLAGGQSLWLVPPGDVEALASGLQTLLGDDALRQRLGQAAREASAPFDWTTIAERHAALYAEVLTAGG
jgi:glycosyltransferase involved in cell wall biosynthesis